MRRFCEAQFKQPTTAENKLKTAVVMFGLLSLLAPAASVLASHEESCGDVTLDHHIDVVDIVLMVKFIVGSEVPSSSQRINADTNCDAIINVVDIVGVVGRIFGWHVCAIQKFDRPLGNLQGYAFGFVEVKAIFVRLGLECLKLKLDVCCFG